MAKGINKVILIGNLGSDPVARQTPPPDSLAVTNLSIATSRSRKSKDSDKYEEHTEWHRVVLYRRLAEIANEYLRKGSKVYIEGSLRTRKWVDDKGSERYMTEIIGHELQMLDGKSASDAVRPPENAAVVKTTFSTDFDEDVPF